MFSRILPRISNKKFKNNNSLFFQQTKLIVIGSNSNLTINSKNNMVNNGGRQLRRFVTKIQMNPDFQQKLSKLTYDKAVSLILLLI